LVVRSRDDGTIQHSTIDKLVGTFKICVDESGSIEQVVLLRTTGFADYDRNIIAAIHAWRYKPYIVDGQAHPVCTAVTFIFSMH
jgi:TonB family protein